MPASNMVGWNEPDVHQKNAVEVNSWKIINGLICYSILWYAVI